MRSKQKTRFPSQVQVCVLRILYHTSGVQVGQHPKTLRVLTECSQLPQLVGPAASESLVRHRVTLECSDTSLHLQAK